MGADAEHIAAVFGRAAATYETVVPFFGVFGERLVGLVDPRPGERVLDVASGRGATLIPTARRIAPTGSVVGIDLAAEMVELLTEEIEAQGLGNASVRRMDAHSLEFDDDSFDVALYAFVLHLLPDPARAATECLRVLRPGGRCAMSVPTGAGAQWQFVGDLFRTFAPRAAEPPAMVFRPEFDADAVIVGAGFDIVRAVDEEVEIVFPDEQAWWDWAWSQGSRALFEVLAPDALDELREAAFAELRARATPDGIRMPQRAHYIIAAKRGAVA